MSGLKIVTMICWIITALVLAGLVIWFVTGSLFGGWFGNWGNNMPFGINIGGFENLTGPFTTQGNETISTSGLNTIRVNWVAGDVTIIPHDGNDVKIEEFAQRELRDNEQMRVTIDGASLSIDFRGKGTFRGNMPRKNLEVLVPRTLSENLTNLTVNSTSGNIKVDDFKADTVKIISVSAGIRVSGINANNVELNTTSGAITASAIRAGKLGTSSVSGAVNLSDTVATAVDCSTTSGATYLSGEFEKVDVSSVSGSTVIKSATVPGGVNVSSVSGAIDLHIPDTGTITVSHSAVSGRFSSEVPVTMQNGGTYSFSSVSGNTNIHLFN